MEFLMHDSVLYYYKPTNKNSLLLKKIYKNKEGFSKRKIKDAVKDRELQYTLGFNTVKEVKWITWSNYIQDFPVKIEDLDNSEIIWGKYIPYLKGKATRKKPIRVSEDIIRVTK